jgi:threonylcarbamoyladenosine tRNA methylthiotransferase MtaB
VVGGDRKSALLDLPGFLAQESKALLHETAATNPQALIPLLPVLLSQWVQAREGSPVPQEDRFRFNPGDFSFHSRASLKIQDGCDKRCSYCRVSLARGPSVSLEARKSLSGLRALEEKGYGEAVLTGVNIGQYREGPRDLADLLDYLLAGTGYIRLRLSSLGPDELSPRLMAVLGHPRIRPHFHLSVQSGSSLILEKMGRSYTPDAVVQGVTQLRSVKEDPFIACDIITGFPGETKEAFEATRRLCEGLDFAWIHPFPYSPRPGTKAYTFKEPVSEREARFRVERLLALAAEGRRGYIRRWIGKTVEGIAEAPGELSSPGAVVADNYLKLLLTIPEGAAPPQPGSALRCRICGVYSGESPFDAAATLVST